MDILLSCSRCGTPYHAHKSTSSLPLTYCGVLCERADLGGNVLAEIERYVLALSPKDREKAGVSD